MMWNPPWEQVFRQITRVPSLSSCTVPNLHVNNPLLGILNSMLNANQHERFLLGTFLLHLQLQIFQMLPSRIIGYINVFSRK